MSGRSQAQSQAPYQQPNPQIPSQTIPDSSFQLPIWAIRETRRYTVSYSTVECAGGREHCSAQLVPLVFDIVVYSGARTQSALLRCVVIMFV